MWAAKCLVGKADAIGLVTDCVHEKNAICVVAQWVYAISELVAGVGAIDGEGRET